MEKKKSQIELLYKDKKKSIIWIVVLFIVTVSLSLISLFVGQYGMTFTDTIKSLLGINSGVEAENIQKIIFNIRVPRTLASVVIGGILAIAGLTYQCVFRNTLVSQDILGISTSSCVGAALGIVLGFGALQTQLFAFALGVLNLALIFILSSRIKLDKTLSLILSGILIGGAMSSVLALIKYMANPETQLQAIVFWTMGDISSISLEQLGFIAIPVTICTIILFAKRWDLNYFCFIDSEAKSMGFNIGSNRILFLACATVLVASAVSISGSIGWVGLVIPQLVRLLIGTNNRYTMPFSFLMGSSFLLLVDIINRLISTAELPVSILSGLLGLPLFIVCRFINTKHSEERNR